MMDKGAHISDDGKYRYTLWRNWTKQYERPKIVVFIGLNPSTADAENDDPTIRRCIGFAKSWGFSALYMVNLFALRATDPKVLKTSKEPEGPLNLSMVKQLCSLAELNIIAWGNHGNFRDQDKLYLNFISNPRHLGLTKSGNPKHPLYLPLSVTPELWRK